MDNRHSAMDKSWTLCGQLAGFNVLSGLAAAHRLPTTYPQLRKQPVTHKLHSPCYCWRYGASFFRLRR